MWNISLKSSMLWKVNSKEENLYLVIWLNDETLFICMSIEKPIKHWFYFYYLQSTYFIFQKEEWTIAYKLFAVTTFSSIMIFLLRCQSSAVQFGLNSFVKIKYRSVTYLMQLHFSTLYIIFLKVLDDFFLFAALHYRTELQCAKTLENSARKT